MFVSCLEYVNRNLFFATELSSSSQRDYTNMFYNDICDNSCRKIWCSSGFLMFSHITKTLNYLQCENISVSKYLLDCFYYIVFDRHDHSFAAFTPNYERNICLKRQRLGNSEKRKTQTQKDDM